jgi:hypothetical protein
LSRNSPVFVWANRGIAVKIKITIHRFITLDPAIVATRYCGKK